MKDVKFLKNHGSRKKDDIISFHVSTAEALAAHKVVEIVGKTPTKTVVVNGLKQTVFDIKK